VVLCSIWFSVPSVLWHCDTVFTCHLTCKNPSPYDLYCVGRTLSLTQSINQSRTIFRWGGHFSYMSEEISSSLQQCKNHKNRLRFSKVMITNVLPPFLWFTVYIWWWCTYPALRAERCLEGFNSDIYQYPVACFRKKFFKWRCIVFQDIRSGKKFTCKKLKFFWCH